MHKQLCACGCGERVTSKVESQHIGMASFNSVEIQEVTQRLVNYEFRQFLRGSGLDLVVTNTQKAVMSCDEDSYKDIGKDRWGAV
jgi:hypothetical protein